MSFVQNKHSISSPLDIIAHSFVFKICLTVFELQIYLFFFLSFTLLADSASCYESYILQKKKKLREMAKSIKFPSLLSPLFPDFFSHKYVNFISGVIISIIPTIHIHNSCLWVTTGHQVRAAQLFPKWSCQHKAPSLSSQFKLFYWISNFSRVPFLWKGFKYVSYFKIGTAVSPIND